MLLLLPLLLVQKQDRRPRARAEVRRRCRCRLFFPSVARVRGGTEKLGGARSERSSGAFGEDVRLRPILFLRGVGLMSVRDKERRERRRKVCVWASLYPSLARV